MVTPHTVVTSWSREGHKQYGQRFLDSFCETGWARMGVDMVVHDDDNILEDPKVRAFRAREADAVSKNIHRDVLRWSWKVFALTMPPMLTEGWMVWIDGDVEFIKTPTATFFDAVCPDDKDVSFLGRPWAYASETGFVAYNMARWTTRLLLDDMRTMYLTGTFRALDSWTDGAVFDCCRQMATPHLRENDLSAHCESGGGLHVWPETVLAEFLTHHKGPKRKQLAYG